MGGSVLFRVYVVEGREKSCQEKGAVEKLQRRGAFSDACVPSCFGHI